MNRRHLLASLSAAGAAIAALGADATADNRHHGDATGPVTGPFAHLCGIHVAKRDPRIQIITQHYCVNHQNHSDQPGVFQCLLFDSGKSGAKLLGVEYIISDKHYQALPEAEKKYWHPHAYEILAGGLIMPGVSFEKELQHLRNFLPSWGKTWHTWPDPASDLPIGEPLLMWSLTGDGQADEEVVARRDREFQVSMDTLRERRCRELKLEVPQVSFPRSVDQVGRQWTDQGEDRPHTRS
jgi:hypothetical protein